MRLVREGWALPIAPNPSEVKGLCSDIGTMPALVDRCVAGDQEAWRQLFALYHPVVLRFLRRMGLPSVDAADAAQEVFVQVYRFVGRFERRSDLKTWLYKVCLSQASRHHRARRVQNALRLLLPLARPTAPRPGELLESEAQRVLTAALSKLKRMHCEVFILFEVEGLPGQEIARVLDCPVATVWRRLHYARKELASILGCPAPQEGNDEIDR